jgi:hypothetical protein
LHGVGVESGGAELAGVHTGSGVREETRQEARDEVGGPPVEGEEAEGNEAAIVREGGGGGRGRQQVSEHGERDEGMGGR